MTNRNMTFRTFVETISRLDRTRRAFASVRRGKNVRRRDAGVLRTLARGAR